MKKLLLARIYFWLRQYTFADKDDFLMYKELLNVNKIDDYTLIFDNTDYIKVYFTINNNNTSCLFLKKFNI